MNKSQKYIIENMRKIIDDAIEKISCSHKWEKYGYGYKCKFCKFYTGGNEKLNNLIRFEISKNPLKFVLKFFDFFGSKFKKVDGFIEEVSKKDKFNKFNEWNYEVYDKE